MERVKFLVKHGANVNAKCKDGMTALHIAAKNNHKETALALIDLNADVFIRDNNNTPPFKEHHSSNELFGLCLKLSMKRIAKEVHSILLNVMLNLFIRHDKVVSSF